MSSTPSPQGQPVTAEDIAWFKRTLYAYAEERAVGELDHASASRLLAALRGSGQTSEGTPMRRFTMFRRGDLSATHNAQQAAPPDDPQFEGVVFRDGTVAIRWLTALRSTSVWADLDTAMGVHGHPEARYQSEIVWHDAPPSPSDPKPTEEA